MKGNEDILEICRTEDETKLQAVPRSQLEKACNKETGDSALITSCYNKNSSCCDFLLHNAPRLVNRTNINCQNALHVAVSSNNENHVRSLLGVEKKLAHAKDRNGHTPIHVAVMENNETIASLLLPHSNLNECDQKGRNPVLLAFEKGSCLDGEGTCLSLFKEKAPELYATAVAKRGTFGQWKDCKGTTTLQTQIRGLRLSLEAKNDLVYQPLISEIPSDFNFSFRSNKETPMTLLAKQRTGKRQALVLMEAKGALDLPNGHGLLPTAAAAWGGNKAVLTYLLERRFSWGSKDHKYALSVLLYFPSADSMGCVDLLLKFGSPVNGIGLEQASHRYKPALRRKLTAAGFAAENKKRAVEIARLSDICVSVVRDSLSCTSRNTNLFYLTSLLPLPTKLKKMITLGELLSE